MVYEINHSVLDANIAPVLTFEAGDHPVMFAEKLVASANMYRMSVTLLTFHLLRSWLNVRAP